MPEAPALADAGRHLISTDPAARTEQKLAHVSHAELADERALSASHLARARRYGVHHHGWWFAESPAGELPADLERLARLCPSAKRQTPLPGMPVRLLVRTWAWLRFWPRLGSGLVRTIDRHFESLIPLLAAPLLLAEVIRRASVRMGWRWLRLVGTSVPDHGHGHNGG
jgi:hypothetical protein